MVHIQVKFGSLSKPQLWRVAFGCGVVIIGLASLSDGPVALVILPTLLFCATAWLGTAQPQAAGAIAVAAESGVVVGFLASLPFYGLFIRGENNLWPLVLLALVVIGSPAAVAGSMVGELIAKWRHRLR